MCLLNATGNSVSTQPEYYELLFWGQGPQLQRRMGLSLSERTVSNQLLIKNLM
jgi:hypothetical protein